jgi:hypothetical protein
MVWIIAVENMMPALQIGILITTKSWPVKSILTGVTICCVIVRAPMPIFPMKGRTLRYSALCVQEEMLKTEKDGSAAKLR